MTYDQWLNATDNGQKPLRPEDTEFHRVCKERDILLRAVYIASNRFAMMSDHGNRDVEKVLDEAIAVCEGRD